MQIMKKSAFLTLFSLRPDPEKKQEKICEKTLLFLIKKDRNTPADICGKKIK